VVALDARSEPAGTWSSGSGSAARTGSAQGRGDGVSTDEEQLAQFLAAATVHAALAIAAAIREAHQ
jgi:hypothetical protein